MSNVRLTCDAQATAKEVVKVLKSKDHVDAPKQRLEKWKNGEFLQLLREATALKSWLAKIGMIKNIDAVSRKFR